MNEVINLILHLLDYVPLARAVISFVLILFLPGFAWTLIFFKQLSIPARIAFSFGLSLAVVTLSILVSNVVFQVKITGINSLVIIILVTTIPLTIYYVNRAREKRSNESPQIQKKIKGSLLRLLRRLSFWTE
ncbi:MAG: DUF1616 domain-containing protein [Dehalococcoidales bacterium]|nr:DUF1616 domain-containing protein [Dehalococcoidales bacterium]